MQKELLYIKSSAMHLKCNFDLSTNDPSSTPHNARLHFPPSEAFSRTDSSSSMKKTTIGARDKMAPGCRPLAGRRVKFSGDVSAAVAMLM